MLFGFHYDVPHHFCSFDWGPKIILRLLRMSSLKLSKASRRICSPRSKRIGDFRLASPPGRPGTRFGPRESCRGLVAHRQRKSLFSVARGCPRRTFLRYPACRPMEDRCAQLSKGIRAEAWWATTETASSTTCALGTPGFVPVSGTADASAFEADVGLGCDDHRCR